MGQYDSFIRDSSAPAMLTTVVTAKHSLRPYLSAKNVASGFKTTEAAMEMKSALLPMMLRSHDRSSKKFTLCTSGQLTRVELEAGTCCAGFSLGAGLRLAVCVRTKVIWRVEDIKVGVRYNGVGKADQSKRRKHDFLDEPVVVGDR